MNIFGDMHRKITLDVSVEIYNIMLTPIRSGDAMFTLEQKMY